MTPPPPLATTAPLAENSCTGGGQGKRSYADAREGFCFFYPDDFFVNKPGQGNVEFLGPALDKSLQPVRAYINIAKKEPVGNRTLDEIAMSVWKEARSAYRLANISMGEQDALVA